MHTLRFMELGRAIGAALLTVAIASSAIAQPVSRISRTESDFDSLDRRLAPGEIGSIDDALGPRSILDSSRPIDISTIDKSKLANLMKEAFDESSRLYSLLDADYRRNPQLRSLMSDLVRLRSQTNRVNQDVAAGISLQTVVIDFRQLDADWRLFSHRMSQATGLSSATKQSLERLDNLDRQIGKLFKVEPTLDRRSLVDQLYILENSLYTIADDLDRDINGSTTTAQLASGARKLQQQVSRITEMVLDSQSYDRIVSEHTRFERTWTVQMEQLRLVNNSYVARAVQRIVDADNQLHVLLWIEDGTSRTQLKQTADALLKDVDEFYNRTPLKLLLAFKSAAGALETADNFYGTVQNFKDNLNRNESDEMLVDSYGDVERYGTIFVRTFSVMKSQTGIVVLREIEDGIAALRSELNLGGTVNQVDTRRLLPIAASLENLADQLDLDVRNWMSVERPAYRNEVIAASSAFIKRTQRLSRLLDTEPSLAEVQKETDSLYLDWKAVYAFLGRCNTADRTNLSQVAAEVRADLTDLFSSLRL